VKKRVPAKLLEMQDGASEGSMVPKFDFFSEVNGALSAFLPSEHSSEVLVDSVSRALLFLIAFLQRPLPEDMLEFLVKHCQIMRDCGVENIDLTLNFFDQSVHLFFR